MKYTKLGPRGPLVSTIGFGASDLGVIPEEDILVL